MNKSVLGVRKSSKRKKKDVETLDLDAGEVYSVLKEELVSIKCMLTTVEEKLSNLLDENVSLKTEVSSLRSEIKKTNKCKQETNTQHKGNVRRQSEEQ